MLEATETREEMDLILCHSTADFDALGAAVGLTRLKPGARIVLTGGAHPTVREFLALHRDEFALIERRSVNPQQIRSIMVVDAAMRDRVSSASEWLDLPSIQSIEVYDHHLHNDSDIPATRTVIESVGATTTIIVEQLQAKTIEITPLEATVMALGIHVDTGSLRYAQTTPRDALALAWLLEKGASLRDIADYAEPSLSPQLQDLLAEALEKRTSENVHGYTLSWVLLNTENFVAGLSGVVEQLEELTESDALIVAASYTRKSENQRMSIIARSRIPSTNLNSLLQPFGGGGHSQAASANLRDVNPQETLEDILTQFKAQIPQPPTAREIMSSPVRTIRPHITIQEAQRILLRYGHSGLSVVNEKDELVGVISRRDLDLALHHGFSHAPVKGYMSRNVKTISPDTLITEIESIMVTYDVGRLPVIEGEKLLGIVTRTDVLRQRHSEDWGLDQNVNHPPTEQEKIVQCLLRQPKSLLKPSTWQLLTHAATEAEKRGWHLYLVGGAVRDILLAEDTETLQLQDIDLVVDGFYNSADVGAGVELAKALQQQYPQARLDVHGAFQTAALLWHNDPELDSLWVDIATARTEFYPYPAANPEVEASSIRQDLYRRDFTINALAVRLTSPRKGELLDFFGGILDLQSRQVRVLHANSFIEDPTRIYRAVRFAVRLGFGIESQTEEYIRYAIESGVYDRFLTSSEDKRKAPALQTRLKSELKYILQAPYWKPALQLLGSLGALRCLHPSLELDATLEWQVRLVDRCLRKFDPEHSLTHWQMRLEVLIAHLEPSERAKVANNLQLPVDSIERLQNIAKVRAKVVETLPDYSRPSEVVKLLRQYKLPMLVLLAAKTSRTIRRSIWCYLTKWSQIQPPLDGNDLKALGYKPGPQYKKMLDALLAARLDGVIGDNHLEAETFLREYRDEFSFSG